MKAGLTSVTLKTLSIEQVIKIVKSSELTGIEWSSNDHVIPGDLHLAKYVKKACVAAGISLPSYGSYYRAGLASNKVETFKPILASAVELGVQTIRVWAGVCGSLTCSPKDCQRVLDDLCQIGQLAKQVGIKIGCEYHCNTLTDTTASALKLARAVSDSNVNLYWQPPNGVPVEDSLKGLKSILPFFNTLHLFAWDCSGESIVRLPLSAGKSWWEIYLQEIAKVAPESWALIEFVKDDSPAQVIEDGKTLKRWLSNL